ncbi:cytidylate kinase [candidate division SR1 bacterium]|nr:cytidylate kinase [candidate division SR1 bacterium]
MLITLGGKAGSGKSTIAKLLSSKLGYEIISIGNMKRKLAEEMGLSIQEFSLLGDKPENQAEFDLKYEDFQKNLKLSDKIILDSRLGFYAQPKAFRIFLDVSDEVASQRIFGDHRTNESFEDQNQAFQEIKQRNKADQNRYLSLYNIDIWDADNYSLVVDTSDKTPEQILEIILQYFLNNFSPDTSL